MYNGDFTDMSQDDYMGYFMVCLGMGKMEAGKYLKMFDWGEE